MIEKKLIDNLKNVWMVELLNSWVYEWIDRCKDNWVGEEISRGSEFHK